MAVIHVVYGIIEDPGMALARERAAHPSGSVLGPMSATIERGSPALRLNTHGWANISAETVTGLSDTDALLAYCRERLHNRVSIFSLSIRAFLSSYLHFAQSEVERRREEFEQRIDESGLPRALGFPDYRDFIFSALLPLPNAYIAIGDETGGEPFVRVDALFWNGTSAVAVMLEGRSMPTPRNLRSLRRLQEAHPEISVVRISADGPSPFGGPPLEPFPGDFLTDAGVPFGPYRVLHRG